MRIGVSCAHHAPFRALTRSAFVPLHGYINWRFDVGGSAGLDHVAQQIRPRQMWMRKADLGWVVGPAVVALCENCD